MHRLLLVLFFALLLAACGSKLGSADAALLGSWKAADTYGGETWTFRGDGTFSTAGGAPKNLSASGTLARQGRWGVKDGLLTLDYTTLATREKPTYVWKIEAGRLLLSTPGNTAPSIILDRTK